MIVQEILTARSKPQEDLDTILAKCCEMVLDGQTKEPDYYGMVAACAIGPNGEKIYGLNYADDKGTRVHAERAAIDKSNAIGPEWIIVTTLSPCNRPMDERSGDSCEDLLKDLGINHVYCGYKDPTQDHDKSVETKNTKLRELCKKLADTFLKKTVTEAFDQPYSMTWEHGDGSHDALVKLPDGTNLSIMFSIDYDGNGEEEWTVEFWRNNSQDATGEGDQQRIFATVLNAIQQFIKIENPERIRFSANKDVEPGQKANSRSNLYNKLVQRYGNTWGYEVDTSDYAGSTVYNLYKLYEQKVNEITSVPTVAKSKRQHLDVMPNDGKPIPKGREEYFLGDMITGISEGYQLWSWADRGTVTYYVYDTENRICQLATTGRPYKTNRDSFVVQGVYSGPKNKFRAADLYAFLILNQGLTLVSDNKQSAGGYRVWQELEHRYKTINVHGFDTNTNKGVNVTTQDEPDTHVDRATVKTAGPQMKKELGTISRDLRFVASKK